MSRPRTDTGGDRDDAITTHSTADRNLLAVDLHVALLIGGNQRRQTADLSRLPHPLQRFAGGAF